MVIGLLGLGTVGGGVYNLVNGRTDMSIKYVCCLEKPEGLTAILTSNFDDIVNDPEVDTVVEVMGGLHPAREFAIKAMSAGKNYVTANKLLIAECFQELTALAAEKGVALRCTAAAGGARSASPSVSVSAPAMGASSGGKPPAGGQMLMPMPRMA